MENIREKIVEIITHTHKTPLEQADEILLLFSVSGQSEKLNAFDKLYDIAWELCSSKQLEEIIELRKAFNSH